jgi:hypothetical protein
MFEGRFPGWTQRGRGKKLGIANGKWQVVNSVPEEGRDSGGFVVDAEARKRASDLT